MDSVNLTQGESACNEPQSIFAETAHLYARHGLRVFPTGGDDGKKPLIRGWRKVGRRAVDELARKFPDANVAFLDGGKGGITRVDIDDPALADQCVERFGDTPIKVATPSGGLHLWYRANGERRRIKVDGLDVDILGEGGMGIAPPSINPQKGAYRFIAGGPEEIPHLPQIDADGLPAASQAPSEGKSRLRQMRNGDGRNNALFHRALRLARGAQTEGDLLEMVLSVNSEFGEPLPMDEAQSVTRSVWGYKENGHLMVANTETPTMILPSELATLADAPVAILLLLRLRTAHGWRHGREFALANAMAESLGVSVNTFRKARKALVERFFLEITHPGGRGENDPPKARLI